MHAFRLAPSVAAARAGDRTERGIDVEFPTEAAARNAKAPIIEALRAEGFAELADVWLWRPESGGGPATTAGHRPRRELRLAPRLRRSVEGSVRTDPNEIQRRDATSALRHAAELVWLPRW